MSGGYCWAAPSILSSAWVTRNPSTILASFAPIPTTIHPVCPVLLSSAHFISYLHHHHHHRQIARGIVSFHPLSILCSLCVNQFISCTLPYSFLPSYSSSRSFIPPSCDEWNGESTWHGMGGGAGSTLTRDRRLKTEWAMGSGKERNDLSHLGAILHHELVFKLSCIYSNRIQLN